MESDPSHLIRDFDPLLDVLWQQPEIVSDESFKFGGAQAFDTAFVAALVASLGGEEEDLICQARVVPNSDAFVARLHLYHCCRSCASVFQDVFISWGVELARAWDKVIALLELE